MLEQEHGQTTIDFVRTVIERPQQPFLTFYHTHNGMLEDHIPDDRPKHEKKLVRNIGFIKL
jgi:hypothetical protein